MKKRRIIIITLICVVICIFAYFKWTRYQFEVRLKSYLSELYPEDKFVIDQIAYDYKFRKYVSFVKPVHSNFIFQIRVQGDKLISDYGYRYWEYLVESELDVYLKNEFTHKVYSKYGIPGSSDIDKLSLEGEKIPYRDVRDKLTSAYLRIQLGAYPMTDGELEKLLIYIRDKGFMFSDLRIWGAESVWQDHRFVVKYDELHNIPIERIVYEWNNGISFQEVG